MSLLLIVSQQLGTTLLIFTGNMHQALPPVPEDWIIKL